MRSIRGLLTRTLVVVSVLAPGDQVRAQARAARGPDAPVLRLQAGGPTSYVTGLAFTRDGRSLYEAGWDKVVRVWSEDAQTQEFALDERASLRVPIGPGLDGAINAMALSPDGAWLAVAGRGVVPGSAGFLQNGLVVPSPAKTDEMRWAEGTIFVFDTRAQAPSAVALRGHRGPVLSLAFAPIRAGKPPLLVSAGHEVDRSAEVRLWDVSTGEYLTGLSGLPGPQTYKTRPSLALWHTGAGRNQVRVAIAWWSGEFGKDVGTLRLWDADRGQAVTSLPDGQVNDTLALLADPPQLLTGSFPVRGSRSLQGQLTTWGVTGARGPTIALPANTRDAAPGIVYLPRALAAVAEAPGGRTRYAATILQRLGGPAGEAGYELRLVDLSPGALGVTRSSVKLPMRSAAASAQPVLAVDAEGKRLALALGEEREVDVFSIPDLLAGRSEPRQVLRSAGASMAYVSFARRGNETGLVLGQEPAPGLNAPPREPGPSDLVFDFAGRRLAPQRERWLATRPPLDDWTVEPLPAGNAPRSVRVRQANGQPRTIEVPAGESITAMAFHARPPGGVPILAIASRQNSGEPMLRLYSAASGEWIRQLTGHAERIRALAFSEDGRLLASTADDRTISVWSLVDLRQTLGKRGQLRGLSVTEQGGRLVVKAVDEGAGLALRAGDGVEGIVEQGTLRPLRSVVDFYNAVSVFAPGRPLTLRRSRGQQGGADVPVPVGQGTDERKPLFSLFVSPGEAAGDWRWIGWNPQGPYETSGPELESMIGWHFNTGNPAAPTRFALAPEYHDRFYHHEILKELVGRGSLPPPAPPPLPAPNMSMAFDSAAELAGSQIVVRQAPTTLTLSIVDRPIPAELLGAVTCQVGNFPAVELRPTSDRSWSADVSGLRWAPGIYPVRLKLRTTETAPQTFSMFRELRYQRPAPGVNPAGRAPVVVNDPEFELRCEIVPAATGSVRVRITREPGGEVREQVVRARGEVAQPFRLDPGTNRFIVAATNVGALEGYEREETTEIPALVVNFKQKALAPAVELTVVPAGSDTALVPERGATVLVSTPKVALRGRILAQENLVAAERLQAARAPAPLARFVAGRSKTFLIDEPLTLEPGLQTYVVRARAADSDPGENRITIQYQPRLPRVEAVELSPARPVLFEHEDEPRVSLSARLIAPEDLQALEAAVVVDSEGEAQPRVVPAEVKKDAPADELALKLTADVPLAPGENHLRIRLKNRWGSEWTGDESIVAYRRPPRVVELKAPATTEKGTIAVEAAVESALELSEAQLEVTHDSQPRRLKAAFVRREGTSWTVSSGDVPLEPGPSTIRVMARNADGWNHIPGPGPQVAFTRPRVLEPPVIAPPEVPLTTTEGELVATLSLTSARPLESMEVRRKVSESEWETAAAPSIEPLGKDDRGRSRYQARVRLHLVDGLNHVEAVARSEDGDARVEFVVSRVPPPVRFVVDGFETQADRSTLLSPDTPLPDGRVWVTGRVLWPDAEVKRRNESKRVQVLVNGFPHVETRLLPEGRSSSGGRSGRNKATESSFRAGILLGRPENSLQIKLGDAATATEGRLLTVGCMKPDTRQRLHLLMIGIGAQDKAQLKAEALKAVQGELLSDRPDERLFKTPAFESGKIYGPLSDEFTKMHVLAQISLICEQIRLQNNVVGAPTSNEVVLVYYQGGEWIGEGKTALLLRRGRVRKEVAAITVDELVRPFVGTRGAKLLLLDVSAPAPLARAEPWSRGLDHVGLLRFMWLYSGEGKRDEVPEDARLLSVLQNVVPQSVTLRQVKAQLEGKYSLLRQKYPNINFDDNPLPAPFFDLEIGRR